LFSVAGGAIPEMLFETPDALAWIVGAALRKLTRRPGAARGGCVGGLRAAAIGSEDRGSPA